MSEKDYSDVYIHTQQRATRALIKFCEDHGYNVAGVAELRNCLKALERRDIKSAVDSYLKVPIGGMGCFNDWLPPAVFSHETPEYVQAVFEALVQRWTTSLQLSVPGGRK